MNIPDFDTRQAQEVASLAEDERNGFLAAARLVAFGTAAAISQRLGLPQPPVTGIPVNTDDRRALAATLMERLLVEGRSAFFRGFTLGWLRTDPAGMERQLEAHPNLRDAIRGFNG